MLDRVATGAQEGIDAIGSVGVGGDPAAHAVGSLDDGGQFGFGELLAQTGRGVRENAAGRGDLDDVGARADLFADGPHAVVDARANTGRGQDVQDLIAVAVGVAMAAVDGNGGARGDDARADHIATPDRVAQGEDRFIGSAQIGDGGEAGHQGQPGVAHPDHGPVRGRQGDGVQTSGRALLAGQVDVAVDQAGQDKGVAKIDDATLTHEIVADFDHPAAADHNSFIRENSAGCRIRQQTSDLQERRSPIRRKASGDRPLLCEARDCREQKQAKGRQDRTHFTLPGMRLAP